MSEHDEAIAIEGSGRPGPLKGRKPAGLAFRVFSLPRGRGQEMAASRGLRAFDLLAMLGAAFLLLNTTLDVPGGAGWVWRQPGEGRLLLVAALVAPFCFDWAGLYENGARPRRMAALGRAAVALASVLGLLVGIAAVSGPDWPFTAEMLAEWAALTFTLLTLGRVALLASSSLPPMRDVVRERVAVLGSGQLAERVVSHFERGRAATHLVGLFDDQGDAMRRPCGAEPRWRNLRELAMRGEIDRVVIALSNAHQARAAEIARELAPFAIDVAVCSEALPALHEQAMPWADRTGAEAISVGGVPLRRVVRRPLRRGQTVLKALEDRVLGLLLLIGLSPLLLVIAAAVRLTSPGGAFFKQTRHGFRSREFTVYKFRSMRADAADLGGRVQTTRGDPRVTPIGAFLRASSLDELPQLINVVRGEMSLVGPRPLPIDMRTGGLLCSEIVDDYANRHRVKPGITGWAQINGYRGATTTREQVSERVRLDNAYIEGWSLLLDLKILLLTVVRVFRDENAF